jgi:hypothetical protein
MKNLLLITATIFFMQVCEAQINSIDYFGQVPPGSTPVKFAPGFISRDGRYELMSTFSPDGKEFCFSVTNYYWSHFEIWYTKYDSNKWSEPQIIPFLSSSEGEAPFFSPGNNMLYYSSPNWASHPISIWECPRTDSGWGVPIKLGAPFNNGYNQWGFSIANDGTFLFCSDRPGGKGNYDIYISEPVNNEYKSVTDLKNLNSSTAEYSAFITPDKSYIIFSSQRSGGYGWDDLYISFSKGDSAWTNPINLGPTINTVHAEFAPHVTPDGKYLIYSKWDVNSNWSDIYWIRIDNMIDSLKNTISPTGFKEDKKKHPGSSKLNQNYPNPFNPSSVIRYQLSLSSNVKLSIYNMLGQKIKTLVNSFQNAGEHSVVWDAKNEKNNPVSSGIYFFPLVTNGMSLQKKMVLVR